jgi:tetratricopeptide (TPR) repeat protein
MSKILDKIFKLFLYCFIFLIPLFWLPFSFEAFEFNKVYLVFFFVFALVLIDLAKKIFIEKEIAFRRTPLDWPILTFLVVAILSTIFSIDRHSSIFGFYGRFSDGLLLILFLVAFYYLLVNNVGEDKKIKPKSLLNVFSLSVLFVILISYLSIFGVFQKIPQVPPIMRQKVFNPVAGSLEGLAIFLAVSISVFVGRCLTERGKIFVFNLLLALAALSLLVIIDFKSAWLVLSLGLILFVVFSLISRIFRETVNRLLLPIFILIVSLIFLFIDLHPLIKFNFPKEPQIDLATSWKVAFRSSTESFKSAILGSGPGTFFHDFAKFKPAQFNKSVWWRVRFDRPLSHFSEVLATLGFFGFLSYLSLIFLFLLICWFLLSQKLKKSSSYFLIILTLVFAQFFYYQNAALAFCFWFFLALGVASFERPISEKRVKLDQFPELNLIFSVIFILLGITFLVSFYFFGRYYLADNKYLKAMISQDISKMENLLREAVRLNSYNPTYRVALVRNLLSQINNESLKPTPDADKLQNMIYQVIKEARVLTHGVSDSQGNIISKPLSPNNVVSWDTLGRVYRDIQPLTQGATEWGIRSFEKAIELERTNPVLWTELGKLYLVKNDIEKAKECLKKARDLKPDFVQAQIQEALIKERENNLDEAVKQMEEIVTNYPLNIEARFQLGRLYYNKNRIDDAISQFKNVIALFPNHSNSLYSLGVCYLQKGDKEKALSYFEKVLKLNPNNQDVIQKIEQIKREMRQPPKVESEEKPKETEAEKKE